MKTDISSHFTIIIFTVTIPARSPAFPDDDGNSTNTPSLKKLKMMIRIKNNIVIIFTMVIMVIILTFLSKSPSFIPFYYHRYLH